MLAQSASSSGLNFDLRLQNSPIPARLRPIDSRRSALELFTLKLFKVTPPKHLPILPVGSCPTKETKFDRVAFSLAASNAIKPPDVTIRRFGLSRSPIFFLMSS